MFRKLMLTGMLGVGTIAGLAATPTAAEAAPVRVIRTHNRVVYRHWGYRHVVVERPRVVIVEPCIR